MTVDGTNVTDVKKVQFEFPHRGFPTAENSWRIKGIAGASSGIYHVQIPEHGAWCPWQDTTEETVALQNKCSWGLKFAKEQLDIPQHFWKKMLRKLKLNCLCWHAALGTGVKRAAHTTMKTSSQQWSTVEAAVLPLGLDSSPPPRRTEFLSLSRYLTG